MKKLNAAINAVHGVVPQKVLSNQDLEKIVDTSDEWIVSRTGIKERRIVDNGQTLSDMGSEIVIQICKKRGISPLGYDMVIVGTVTADHRFPSTSNIICDKSGATNAWGFDLSAACSGFIYTLVTGQQFIEAGKYKKVIVIGGGDTAMDCVRTAVRQKASDVICLYRRNKENMPGSAREVANAEEEGVEFVWLSSPKEFRGTNKVEKLLVDQIKLGEPDESGRRRPEVQDGSDYEIKADMVIKALGFDPEDLPKLFDANVLQVTKWGTIKADFDTMETNLKGVFALIFFLQLKL
jgi:hypothetical protein